MRSVSPIFAYEACTRYAIHLQRLATRKTHSKIHHNWSTITEEWNSDVKWVNSYWISWTYCVDRISCIVYNVVLWVATNIHTVLKQYYFSGNCLENRMRNLNGRVLAFETFFLQEKPPTSVFLIIIHFYLTSIKLLKLETVLWAHGHSQSDHYRKITTNSESETRLLHPQTSFLFTHLLSWIHDVLYIRQKR